MDGSSKVTVEREPTIPFVLHDDDDDSILPKMPDTGQVGAALSPCFIISVYDVGISRDDVPFKRNVARDNSAITSVQQGDSRSLNSQSFWVAYILECYQGDVSLRDHDPSTEVSGFGVTPGNSGGSLIFLETHRISEGVYNPIAEEQDTVVHELGHAVGRLDAEPVTNGSSQYEAIYMDAIRKTLKPR